jgi:hypothetical protein
LGKRGLLAAYSRHRLARAAQTVQRALADGAAVGADLHALCVNAHAHIVARKPAKWAGEVSSGKRHLCNTPSA